MKLLKGFPSRYKDAPEATGDGWWTHYRLALATIDSGGIVVMYGAHGTGKTRMSWELAKKYKPKDATVSIGGVGWTTGRRDRPAIYTTAMNLFTSIKSSYSPNSEKSEKEVILEYCEAALLVIDEVQVRGETKFEDDKLTAIIDARYMEGMPTMIISNYTREKLAASLSPAVLDRIRENGCGLNFNWTSFRKQGSI